MAAGTAMKLNLTMSPASPQIPMPLQAIIEKGMAATDIHRGMNKTMPESLDCAQEELSQTCSETAFWRAARIFGKKYKNNTLVMAAAATSAAGSA